MAGIRESSRRSRADNGNRLQRRLLSGLQVLARRGYRRAFLRVTRSDVDGALRRVGLEPGVTVCAHSSLSRLGHVAGGAATVTDSLFAAVGRTGSVMMPSYPTRASMKSYLDDGAVFDVRSTPTQLGSIAELFRHAPGVCRSPHPTHSMAAWGPNADELLRDHERSPTPYGPDTPYGRLAKRDDAFVLMVETSILSLLHHLQERVDFPNLYLPGEREATVVDSSGQTRTVRTRVMRPRIPYYIAVPGVSGDDPEWAILHHFALLFPRRTEMDLRTRGFRFPGYGALFDRRHELEQAGVLRTAKLGAGEVGLLHVQGFLSRVEPELRDLIERFRRYYDAEEIAALGLPYF